MYTFKYLLFLFYDVNKIKKEDLVILNAIIDSMRTVIGDYANQVEKSVNGMIIDEHGRVITIQIDLKTAIDTLAKTYENVLGNYATAKIADSIAPYFKKNRKLKRFLPKNLLDVMDQTIDVSEGLSKWNKTLSNT